MSVYRSDDGRRALLQCFDDALDACPSPSTNGPSGRATARLTSSSPAARELVTREIGDFLAE